MLRVEKVQDWDRKLRGICHREEAKQHREAIIHEAHELGHQLVKPHNQRVQ